MANASARHILVATEEQCKELKEKQRAALILLSWLSNIHNVLQELMVESWDLLGRDKW